MSNTSTDCWGCAHMMTEFYTKVRETITKHGQNVLGVTTRPPFTYTIGNHERGLPELLVIGVDSRSITPVLNHFGRMQREKGVALYGDIRFGDALHPVKFIDVTASIAKNKYTIQVGQYYSTENYCVTQMLIPDHEGRFPGDPLCEAPYCYQPVLSDSNA